MVKSFTYTIFAAALIGAAAVSPVSAQTAGTWYGQDYYVACTPPHPSWCAPFATKQNPNPPPSYQIDKPTAFPSEGLCWATVQAGYVLTYPGRFGYCYQDD